MEIKAADVAKLRKMTGAGMMDCKKALTEANGDFDRAQDIIREKGKLVASKRADREATEGVVAARLTDGNKKGYMICLACETDFVAKNEEFIKTANEMLDIAIKNDVADLEALKALKVGAQTVEEMVTEKSGQTGEKIELTYYAKIEAELCASYVHMNNKLGTLVGFNAQIPAEVARCCYASGGYGSDLDQQGGLPGGRARKRTRNRSRTGAVGRQTGSDAG